MPRAAAGRCHPRLALRARDIGACAGAQHIDASSLEVVAQLVGALREDDAGAHDSKLFVLLAVRSTEGIVDEQMRGWVEEVPFVTHMEVGELLPEAARELAILSTPGGRLPDDVLDYLVAHCEARWSLLDPPRALSRFLWVPPRPPLAPCRQETSCRPPRACPSVRRASYAVCP